MKGKRLSKTLACAGLGSRRSLERSILSGQVMVNGMIVKTPQTLVRLGKDRILFCGKPVYKEEKHVYYILNKPKGYLCSHRRLDNRRLVLDLFAQVPSRLFTIGRLDFNTSGLLLLTNDGHFAQKVIHPSSHISKEYLVKSQSDLTCDLLKKISRGTRIEGVWVRPYSVRKVRRGTLKIAVREGKKREVRLLVQNSGVRLLSLTRIRIGGLHLGHLPSGQWREMSEGEKGALFN